MGILTRCREHAGTVRVALVAATLWTGLLLLWEALLTGSVPVGLQWLVGVMLSLSCVLAGEYVLGLQQQRHDSVSSSWLASPPASPHHQQQQQQSHFQPWSSSEGGSYFTAGGQGVPGDAWPGWPGSNDCSSSGASTVLHAVVAGLRPSAVPAAKGKARRMALRAPTQAYSEAHHGRVSLLCVDSNPIDQAVLHMLLISDEGGKFILSLAGSGGEALEAVLSAQWLPDIVLLSSHLPDMRASEVCCQLRSMFSPLELPIILLSHRSGEADMLAALGEGGASDYLIKPLRRMELLARINNQMTIKQSVRREAESHSHYELLAQVLPPHIIQRLAAGGQATLEPESHEEVTILFSDIVGFTQRCSEWPTEYVVAMLDTLFSAFDDICDRHGVFKVETIGDCYMAVAGHDGSSDHTVRMAAMAVDMLEAAEETQRQLLAQGRDGSETLQIRIGMHTGPAHSGVVGKRRPRYCFFGDTVNVASRMESSGWPGTIHLSDAAKQAACNQMTAAAARAAPCSSLSGSCAGRVFVGCSDASSSSRRSSISSLHDAASQDGSSNSSIGSALPWELVDLGIRRVKGKGNMQTHLLKVGNWQAALAAVQAGQQQQEHSGPSCASPCSTTTSDSSRLFCAKHTALAAGAPLSLMGWLQGCGSQADSDSWAIRAGQSVRSLAGGEGYLPLRGRQQQELASPGRQAPKMRRFSAVSFSGVA